MCGQAVNGTIKNSTEIDFEALKNLILDMHGRGQLEKGVYLWGGEPFIYSKMSEAISFIKELGIKLVINTNGTLLKNFNEILVEKEVDSLVVSIDGKEDVHNSIRGGGSFKHTISNVQELINKKKERKTQYPTIASNTVITAENHAKLLDLMDHLNQLGMEIFFLEFPVFFTQEMGKSYEQRFKDDFDREAKTWKGFVGNHNGINLSVLQDQLEQIRKKHRLKTFFIQDLKGPSIHSYFNSPHDFYSHKRCYFVNSTVAVEPNGEVVLCPDFPDYKIGNIYESKISQILGNESYERFRKSLRERGLFSICAKCSHVDSH